MNNKSKSTAQRKRGRSSRQSPPSKATSISAGAIAMAAYTRFLGRGGTHGHDLDDWLEAERELLAASASRYAKLRSDSSRLPQSGDVLVSNPLATVEHEISVVPNPPHVICATHDRAIEQGRALAAELGVDAWLTEDRIHFLSLASYRVPH